MSQDLVEMVERTTTSAVRRRPGPAAARRAARGSGATNTYGPGKVFAIRLLTAALLVAFWQFASGRLLPVYAISSPGDVAKELGNIFTSTSGWRDIRATAQELALGFAVGVVGGTIMGILLGLVKPLGIALEPFIAGVNAIPKIALAPVFVLMLGIGIWTDAVIAGLMVGLIIFYSLYIGAREVDVNLTNMVRLAGGGSWSLLRYVIGPSLVTPFFAGVRAAAPLAVLGVVLGEFVASFEGVGHTLNRGAANLDAAIVYADIVILVAFGFILSVILGLLDSWVNKRLGMS